VLSWIKSLSGFGTRIWVYIFLTRFEKVFQIKFALHEHPPIGE